MKRKRGLLRDECGVEPTVMKILVGIILIAIGLGIGVTLYRHFGGAATHYLDFTVSVTPEGGTIARDDSDTASVSVETFSGYDKIVTLSCSGVPENVEVTFSPVSGTPTFGSTMTIEVGSNASIGTHTLTIKGTGADATEKTATYELTIEQMQAN